MDVTPGDGMQDAVDDLAALFGHPVLIEDGHYRALWWSDQDRADQARVRTILRRSVDPAVRDMMRRLKLATAPGPVRTPALPEVGMQPRWCQALRVGKSLVGFLWVMTDNERLDDRRRAALVACARKAEAALADTLTETDARLRRRYQLLTILRSAPNEEAADELASLEGLGPDATVVVLDQRRGHGWDLGDHLWALPDPLPGRVAASGAPLPLVQLGLAVQRALITRQALSAGAQPDRPSYDALGIWQLVAAAPEYIRPEDIHHGVTALLGLTRTDLLETAETLLSTGGDLTAASEALHVHRTTLFYRIKRIADATGVDLRGDPRMSDLDVALKLVRYRAAG